MSRISKEAAAAALAPESAAVFLHLVTIEPGGGVTLRFADNNEDIVSRGLTYRAAAFTVILPEQTGDAPRPCRLAIDNTDLAVFSEIKKAAGQAVTVTVCVIMADTPDVYERGPLRYVLRNVRATKETVEGDVCDFFLNERKFPRAVYSPEDFEGLFF